MNKITLEWADKIRERHKKLISSVAIHKIEVSAIEVIFEPLLAYAEKKEKELNDRFNKERKVVNCVDCGGEISIFAALIDSDDNAFCKDCMAQRFKLRD